MIKDIRVAFIGNVDSGKSSLIGTLMKGKLDDGRGSARRIIFRHKHEIESGRTSSISSTYIGFDINGNQILSKKMDRTIPWEDLAKSSEKRIQLIDLAGHEKYLKTTVFGLTSMQPDFVIVLIGANMGVKKMTKEHLGIALALEIPIVIVITKIDIAPKNIAKETLQSIRGSLRKAGKMPMLVKTMEQAKLAASGVPSNRITPILPLSNVTGDGLDNLRQLLSSICPNALALSRSISSEKFSDNPEIEELNNKNLVSSHFELPIDETYQIPGVGFVVSGNITSGKVKSNDILLMGPDHSGHFINVMVRTIESMHIPMKEVYAGQTAAFAIRPIHGKKHGIQANKNGIEFRKGMVLVSPDIPIYNFVSRIFEAQVIILHHQTTITIGYQPAINCRTIRQTAEIIEINGSKDKTQTIRTGDRALVTFRFLKYPEYLISKIKFIFRDGQAKGIGKIIRIIKEE